MTPRPQLADRTIALFYEGVLTPGAWCDALSLLCAQIGCEQAALTTWDRGTGQASVHESVGLPSACRDQFTEHYCEVDPAREVMDRIATGRWYVDHEIIGRVAMGRSVFYQDFLRAFGLASIVATPLLRDKFVECFLVFQYAPGASCRRHLHLLPPGMLSHLQRAVRLRRQFADVEERAALDLAILGALDLPLVVVDADGRIQAATARAEAMLMQSPHLTVRQHQIVLGGEGGRRLRGLIRAACAACPTGGGISAADPADAASALQILVTPMPVPLAARYQLSRPLAMVLLHDPNAQSASHEALCQQVYALTPAEARVALGITRGATPKDLARDGGVALATVRSQLSSVLQKTGVRRQADLARMLNAILLLR